MTQEYAARYVREVLGKTKGNVKHAESMVMELVKTDEQLLFGLTKPYLGGIIAHAVQRAAKKQPLPEMPAQEWEPKKIRPSQAQQKQQQTQFSPTTTAPAPSQQSGVTKPKKIGTSHMNGLMAQLEKNIGTDSGKSHQKTATHQASSRHVDAMHQIARGEFRRKPKD